ncbi:putative ribonuclease H-like domain-containing protein [Tanacetum coccineum]
MVIYNALPRKEYERIFMCNTAKEIWKTLLITHQGNSQVKDNKIDLLVQQYEQFVISEDESIDSAFARFNTIITSLKALDEGYSSKNLLGLKDFKMILRVTTTQATHNQTQREYEMWVIRSQAGSIPVQGLCFMVEASENDDLEAMDLKWQLSLLSMRVKRYFQRIGKKIFINANDTAGYDKSKVECFNCHKMRHFAKECRAPRTKRCERLIVKDTLNQTEFTAATYKKGLETIEEQLITYRKNEVLFSNEVAVLKREVACKDYEINVLKSEFKKVKQEKEGIEFKIEKFDNASKSLNKLLESQITDKGKKGLGYNVIPPPHPLIYNRPKKFDLSYYGLDEFKDPKFKSYGSENSKQESNIVCNKKSDYSKENSNDSLVKEQVSKDTSSFVEFSLNVEKETVFLNKKIEFVKPKNHEKPIKKSVREKGIRREYSIARTPQQNGVAERRNMTLIKAARTIGFKPALSFMRPFGCHVTILNTLDNLGKFDGKSDEGFFVGYSLSSKAFRWLFYIDSLTQSMNYVPVAAGTISNESAGTQGELNVGTSTQKEEISQDCIVMLIWKDASYFDSPSKDVGNGEPKSAADDQKKVEMVPILTTPYTRVHKDHDHPIENVIGDVKSSVQTRRMTKPTSKQGFLSAVYEHKTHDTLDTCLYACFLSQIEPTSIAKALSYSSWVETMQEELLQFKLQQVWILVDLPIGKRDIGTKWVYRNKKDKRLIMIRNKARLVAQGHRKEEGIDYEEVFAHVARIEAIRLFLAYASFMGFLVYQMDVKSAFLYGTIGEEVYVTQPRGFKDPAHPDKVYKVVMALYGLHQAPRAWFMLMTLSLALQRRSYVKYVAEILKKFNYTDVKSTSTLIDLEKPLVKDGDADDIDVHLYRSMIGSLMYLIVSRPNIMFTVCACARFQVTPKTSHLLAVKRIFRYLKGNPTLGLWYSRDSPFELVTYTDSDYTGAT